MRLERRLLDIDGEKIVCEFVVRDKNAVIVHGAGLDGRKRYYPIAKELEKQGVGVVMFDFSGYGESSGMIDKLSLEQRLVQARGVIDQIVPSGSSFYILGFSMGGQTACD